MASPIYIPVTKEERLYAVLGLPEQHTVSEQNRSLIIMIHGFPGGYMHGHSNLFGDVEKQCMKSGFDTLRFDFRGCGASDGHERNISFENMKADYRAVLSWALHQGYRRMSIVAEGSGGLVAMASPLNRIKALCLFWPAFDVSVIPNLAKFAPEINLAGIKADLSNLQTPVLIQHGLEDIEIPHDQIEIAKDLFKNVRRVELTTYEGGSNGLSRPAERRSALYHLNQFLLKYT